MQHDNTSSDSGRRDGDLTPEDPDKDSFDQLEPVTVRLTMASAEDGPNGNDYLSLSVEMAGEEGLYVGLNSVDSLEIEVVRWLTWIYGANEPMRLAMSATPTLVPLRNKLMTLARSMMMASAVGATDLPQ